MLDTLYIEEMKQLGTREAKTALAEYASGFGISLRKTRSFDNMVSDLESELKLLDSQPLPENNTGKTTLDLIDQYESQSEDTPEDQKLELLIDTSQTLSEESVEDVKENIDKDTTLQEIVTTEAHTDFSPSFELMGKDVQYYTLQYWILDWIQNNPDWKDNLDSFPYPRELDTVKTLIYYIKKSGSVTVRETRNSTYVRLV